MIDYEIAIEETCSYIYHYLPVTKICLTNDRFKEQCYIRWALYEILEMFYREYFDNSEHISEHLKPTVFEIIDSFIFKLENLLSIKYHWGLDVAKHAALQFKVRLKNTNLF